MLFTTKARALEECLVSLVERVREIRGLLLVDQNGLPLVSTLRSPALEESLGAFAGASTWKPGGMGTLRASISE